MGLVLRSKTGRVVNGGKIMKKTIVLTAVGQDRPGIVANVSKILYETDCNIEDSSMTILKGDFAMILIISLPKELNVTELDSVTLIVEKLKFENDSLRNCEAEVIIKDVLIANGIVYKKNNIMVFDHNKCYNYMVAKDYKHCVNGMIFTKIITHYEMKDQVKNY